MPFEPLNPVATVYYLVSGDYLFFFFGGGLGGAGVSYKYNCHLGRECYGWFLKLFFIILSSIVIVDDFHLDFNLKELHNLVCSFGQHVSVKINQTRHWCGVDVNYLLMLCQMLHGHV